MERLMKNLSKTISSFVVLFFTCNMVLAPVSYAQVAFLPPVGTMVSLTPKFNPLLVKGVKLFPDNPFKFEFIVDTGDKPLNQDQIKVEGQKLVSYFLAALTTPEKEMWVNLSPYEKSRIIPQGFGDTEMGKELLAQDYLLKQIMATALYPERQLGKEFWNKVYGEAAKKFGTTNVPVNTFNKVWILPNEAVVYENAQMNAVFVVQSSLKVMLEQDYLAANKNKAVEQFDMDPAELAKATQKDSAVSAMSSQIIKEIVVPALEKEVNEGENFAKLRQVYQGLILAAWYKKNLKDNVLAKGYIDQGKTKGIDTQDKEINQKIYQQYLKAYKKGAYNFVKEDVDPLTNQVIPRKYFSGGVIGRIPDIKNASPAMVSRFNSQLNDAAMSTRLVTLAATALLIGVGLFSSGGAQAASYQDFLKAVGSGELTLGAEQVTRDNFDRLSRSLKGGEILKVRQGGQVREYSIPRGTNGLAKAFSNALEQAVQVPSAPTAASAVTQPQAVPTPTAVVPSAVGPQPSVRPLGTAANPYVAPVAPPAIAATPAAVLPNVTGQITATATPDGRVAGTIIPAAYPTDRFSRTAMEFYGNPDKLSVEIRKSQGFSDFLKAVGDRKFSEANLLAEKLSNPGAQVTVQNIPGYGQATVTARNQGIVAELRPTTITTGPGSVRSNPLQTFAPSIVMGNLTGRMPRANPIDVDKLPSGYGFIRNTNNTWTFISDPKRVNVDDDTRFNLSGRIEIARELKKHISFEGESEVSESDKEVIIGEIVKRVIAAWKAGNTFELRGFLNFERKRRQPAVGFSQAAFGSATIPVHGFETVKYIYSVNYSISQAFVLGHQVSAQLANKAQLADDPNDPSYGGIDLEKVNVMIKNGVSGTAIKTAFADPRILELMRSAQGLFVQIESVVPMTPPMVNMYLGFNGANAPVQSADQNTTPSFLKSVWVNKEQVLA